ncbi:MAG: Bromodomain-containing protein, partial [Piptocephalis tieghemiana]
MEDKVKRKRQRTSRSVDNQRCRQWLKRIEAHRSAFLFLQPVDPVAHGAPDYLEVIKHPMDLGTIRQKLDAQDDLDIHGDDKGEKYGSQEMWKDVQLVLDNCYFYNPEGSYAYTQAQDLEVVAKRTWKKIFGANPGEERVDEESASITHPPEREITPDELTKVLDTLREHPSASPFLVPVDPEALGIPTYRDVIKHPMDLGTMQAHLVSGQKIPGRPPYHEGRVGIEAFQADFQRIISNCRLFN